jgi:serine/threonine-protein kinase RsbW
MVRRPETRRLASIAFAADKDYLSLARMTAMHVAGLLGLPIGRVTDLRLAVDEACSLFLPPPLAGPQELAEQVRGQLSLQFDQQGATLRIRVSGPAPLHGPDEDDLGWTMLCALVGEPRWEARDGVGTLTLTEPIPTGRR